MHQICADGFQSGFTRLVGWLFDLWARSDQNTCSISNVSHNPHALSFQRQWLDILSDVTVSISYCLFWRVCLHVCWLLLYFPSASRPSLFCCSCRSSHLLFKCELASGSPRRPVSQTPSLVSTSLIRNERLPRCQCRCELAARLSQSLPIEAAIYLDVYQFLPFGASLIINWAARQPPLNVLSFSENS